jgi:hypothetical protein
MRQRKVDEIKCVWPSGKWLRGKGPRARLSFAGRSLSHQKTGPRVVASDDKLIPGSEASGQTPFHLDRFWGKEDVSFGHGLQSSTELEFASMKIGLQPGDEFAAEDAAEYQDGTRKRREEPIHLVLIG